MSRALLIIAALLSLAACNTVEGMGEDISAGARAIDNAI